MSSDSSSTATSSSTVGASATASSDDVYRGKYRVYTKTGDKGTSSLFNMERRSKADDNFQALGDTDELNANIGVVRAHCAQVVAANSTGGSEDDPVNRDACAQLDEQLSEVQSRLFDIGAHLATPRTSSNAAQQARTEFDEHHVDTLEEWIDGMETVLPGLKNFILPSGGLVSSHLHVCRAVCRRAERSSVPLVAREDALPVVARYFNRLSD